VIARPTGLTRPGGRDDGVGSTKSQHALDVEPQQVVVGKTESADLSFGADAAMGSMPIVMVQPASEARGPLVGVAIGPCIQEPRNLEPERRAQGIQ